MCLGQPESGRAGESRIPSESHGGRARHRDCWQPGLPVPLRQWAASAASCALSIKFKVGTRCHGDRAVTVTPGAESLAVKLPVAAAARLAGAAAGLAASWSTAACVAWDAGPGPRAGPLAGGTQAGRLRHGSSPSRRGRGPRHAGASPGPSPSPGQP